MSDPNDQTGDEESPDRQRLLAALAVLQDVVAAPELLNELDAERKAAFFNAAGDVFCPDPDIRRRRTKLLQQQRRSERAQRDDETLAETGIRTLRSKPVFTTPDVFAPTDFVQTSVADDPSAPPFRETIEAQHCYICKTLYREIHHFYDQLCPDCAATNFAKRSELADMTGMVVLLTGGRVKIGYQAGIKLLRCGAELIVMRFPRDAARRYASEADFADWGDRLEVFGIDLRHTPSVEAFSAHLLNSRARLDAIVNNACQTVRRPPGFYEHMMENETAALVSVPDEVRQLVGSYEVLRGTSGAIETGDSSPSVSGSIAGRLRDDADDIAGLTRASELSQAALLPEDAMASDTLFPEGQLDQDLQQIDLRGRNSWRLQLHEVSSVELLETQLVNAVAPFVLNARLKPLMEATPGDHKHIVNVSAVEGQFYRPRKTTKHPHTNMAKAALNMMTRTSATDYHDSGINMNSVDTGWVNDEDPVAIAEAKTAEHRFHPPLDIVDGAARIVDPIIDGINTGNHVWGLFLKDYEPTDWWLFSGLGNRAAVADVQCVMKHSNVNRTLAAVVAVGTLLAACGGNDDDNAEMESGRDGEPEDAEAEMSEPESTEAMEEEARETSEAMEEEPAEEARDEGDTELESGVAPSAADAEAEFDDAEESAADDSDGGLFGEDPAPVDAEAPDDSEARFDDNRFEDYGYRDFVAAAADPLSTFALDVDTGSYSVGRRFLDEGALPPRESVRPEEYINAFDYSYDTPRNGLDITVDGGPSPFDEDNVLVRIGVQGEVVSDADRGDATLTFVVDTSGSMDRDNRLGLVKQSLTILVDELDDDDRVAIVTYSDDSGIVLEPTRVRDRDEILDAIDSLETGGSTNLESGLREGYSLARDVFNEGGINRVIIASDGVANAGITDVDELGRFIREDADNGIDLVTVGFGLGNFNDVLMEQLADNGDGFYAYVDTLDEAERLFEDELTSTLLTVAKDAKIQVEFDDRFVDAYRLIGFENRGVRDSDFDNDDVDAGEIGAGHQVTAMYELRLVDGVDLDDRAELGVVALRWEDPDSGDVTEIDEDIDLRDIEPRWTETADDFQLATVVVTFAEKMRDNPYADEVNLDDLAVEAERIAEVIDTDEVDQLADLIERAARLS